ncbi:class I SAM-dependent methyltransferase [Peristeroidobacter agariperforans]|uniref:class I SAM-dependent methyltransferase n=1 Tax=Peristeroidobacter agariperforans TaxID=268404 RepID=UPI00101CF2E1|nr:class I SAM-dependent methyltransferase [Peristeroidobacter agariperforans]
MSEALVANQDQVALWNDASGRTWVEMQPVLDRMLSPFEAPLIEAAFPGQAGRVLDVGCGSGATTLAMAKRLGTSGRCVGVDISGPLLAAARQRAAADGIDTATFVQADAQTHAFVPGSFDAMISRFGVMFFDAPEAAFDNIRRAMRIGAKLALVAWRSPAENPFMTTAKRAAEPLLTNMPKPDPNAPGQFAFADGNRVRGILQAGGWSDIDVQPLDAEGTIAESELLAYVTRLGPVGLALREVDEATRARVTEVVHAAFQPYIKNGAAHFGMACWLVTATRKH